MDKLTWKLTDWCIDGLRYWPRDNKSIMVVVNWSVVCIEIKKKSTMDEIRVLWPGDGGRRGRDVRAEGSREDTWLMKDIQDLRGKRWSWPGLGMVCMRAYGQAAIETKEMVAVYNYKTVCWACTPAWNDRLMAEIRGGLPWAKWISNDWRSVEKKKLANKNLYWEIKECDGRDEALLALKVVAAVRRHDRHSTAMHADPHWSHSPHWRSPITHFTLENP